MKTVLVFGTFDSLHPGHEFFLEKAKTLGNRLVVVVSRDEFVHVFKKKKALHNEIDRLNLIQNHKLVSEAYLADKELGQFSILNHVKPDIICLGHDQLALAKSIREWMDSHGKHYKLKVLKPYKRHKYSTTLMNNFKEQLHYDSD